MNTHHLIDDISGKAEMDISKLDMSVNKQPGCYAIFCSENGMYYIGSSISCANRKYTHFNDLRNGQPLNAGLFRDIALFPISCFHFFVIEYCEPAALEDIEKRWWAAIPKDRLYNSNRRITRKNTNTKAITRCK